MSTTLFSAKAIVLSCRDFLEADRWYSVLTSEHGKLEFRARGAKKPLAKLTPHLEMPAELELLLIDGRRYFTIAGVERRVTFPKMYRDVSKLTLARNALYLTDIGTKEMEQDIQLYPLVSEWLAFVNDAPDFTNERAGYLLSSFALKLISIIGYHPQLSHCLSCEKPATSNQMKWHGLRGGLVCNDCVQKDKEQWFAARPLSDEVLKLTRFALAQPFEEQLRLHLTGEALLGYHQVVESLIVSHFPVIPASSLRGSCLLAI